MGDATVVLKEMGPANVMLAGEVSNVTAVSGLLHPISELKVVMVSSAALAKPLFQRDFILCTI